MLLGQVSPQHPLSFTMTRKTLRSHPRLWRAQEGALPFNSKGVSGARSSMESPRGSSVIQFSTRSTAFNGHGEPKGALPFNSEGVSGARPSMESQGSSTIPFNPKGVPGARPSFHDDHHGISQNPFGIVICLYVCVF